MRKFHKYRFYLTAAAIFSLVNLIIFIKLNSEEPKDKLNCNAKGCHSDLIGKNFKHAPAVDDCSTCHTMNKGKHPDDNGKEFDLVAKMPELCGNCHDLTIKDSKSAHQPVKDGDCMVCHNPHSSNIKGILNSNDGRSICSMCHDMEEKNKIVHNPVKNENCTVCHSTHYSKYPKLLKAKENDNCLGCHSKEIKSGDRTIENIKQKLSAKNVHSPVQTDNCYSCHKPHSSNVPHLLNSAYPGDFYTESNPEKFSLCFSCHDKNLVEKKLTTKTTNFRNADKNLHFLHINGSKGRNCGVCHDVHGSDLDRMIKKKVKFGNWTFEMKYVKNDKGGSCSPGCHKTLSYNNVDINLAGSSEKIVDKPESALGVLIGKIRLPADFDVTTIDDYYVNIKSIKNNIDSNVRTDNELNYRIEKLPYGDYCVTLSEETASELSITTKLPEIKTILSNEKPTPIKAELNVPKNIIKPKPKIEPNVNKLISYKSSKSITNVDENLDLYIQSICSYLKRHTNARVQITAYTDNQGQMEELRLKSEKTANLIAKRLNACGINNSRIFAQGKGSLQPIASNADSKGRAKNNRLEILVIQ